MRFPAPALLAALLLGCHASPGADAAADAGPVGEPIGGRTQNFPEAGTFDPAPPGATGYEDAWPQSGATDGGADGGSAENQACFTSSVSGTLCAPNGDTPIAGAQVAAQTHDCDGQPSSVEGTTDAAGHFLLRGVAPGTTRVVARSGSFLVQTDVEVPDGGTGYVGGSTGKVCFAAGETPVAVLTGAFDHVERVLSHLGFAYDSFCGTYGDAAPARRLLQDPAALARYRVLFINCGSGVVLRAEDAYTHSEFENLRRFVAQGGSLYISDLSSDFVSRLWPDAVRPIERPHLAQTVELPPCCQCGASCPAECPLPADPRQCGSDSRFGNQCRGGFISVIGLGPAGSVGATLHAPFLRSALGTERVEIVFDLAGWMQIQDVGPGVEILASGREISAAAEHPLMVMFQPEPGGGRVAYTSFHNSAQADETVDRLISALVLRL